MIFVCLPSVVASASEVVGSYLYATVYNYDYAYCAKADANTGRVRATTYLRCADGNVPAGYLGVYARLYSESGSLKVSSGWTYNSSSASAIQTTTEYATTSGTYYSKGQVRMYNGNGYANYNTTQSPYIQGRTASRLEDIYNINENNEIYGSELFLAEYNITPDLILAEGNNGKIGYVRYEDLNEETPNDLGEAIEYQSNLPDSRVIPLYDSDGVTVIDSFTIYYNCVEEH